MSPKGIYPRKVPNPAMSRTSQMRELWATPEYKEMMLPIVRKLAKEARKIRQKYPRRLVAGARKGGLAVWEKRRADPLYRSRHREASRKNIAVARTFVRNKSSRPQKFIFSSLRSRGFHPTLEYSIGPFSVDIALKDRKIAIEVDGYPWHSYEDVRRKDRRKDRYLRNLGWRVIRIPSSESSISELVDILTGKKTEKYYGRFAKPANITRFCREPLFPRMEEE